MGVLRWIALVLAFCAASAAQALTPDQRQERQFLRDAAVHLRFQAAASKLALEKSASAGVRQVAASLVNHCSVAQPEVLHLLHVRGMAMPMLTTEESRVLRALAKLSGAKFDRVYLEEVALRANQLDAAQYERITAVTHDPQLQAWAGRHLPTVRYHAQLASRAQPAAGTQVIGNAPARLVSLGRSR